MTERHASPTASPCLEREQPHLQNVGAWQTPYVPDCSMYTVWLGHSQQHLHTAERSSPPPNCCNGGPIACSLSVSETCTPNYPCLPLLDAGSTFFERLQALAGITLPSSELLANNSSGCTAGLVFIAQHVCCAHTLVAAAACTSPMLHPCLAYVLGCGLLACVGWATPTLANTQSTPVIIATCTLPQSVQKSVTHR
jgi:hypothetical protein